MFLQTEPVLGYLPVKYTAGKIPIPVLIAFPVTVQETIAIGLAVNVPAPEGRIVAWSIVVKMRAVRIVCLFAAPVICSGVEPVLIATIVRAHRIRIRWITCPVISGVIANRVVVYRDLITPVRTIAVTMAVMTGAPITASIPIPVAITVSISPAAVV